MYVEYTQCTWCIVGIRGMFSIHGRGLHVNKCTLYVFDIRGVRSIYYVVYVQHTWCMLSICGGSEMRGKSLPQLFNYFLYRK